MCVPPASPFAPGRAAARLQPPAGAACRSWWLLLQGVGGPPESAQVLAAAQLEQPAVNSILSGL